MDTLEGLRDRIARVEADIARAEQLVGRSVTLRAPDGALCSFTFEGTGLDSLRRHRDQLKDAAFAAALASVDILATLHHD